MASCTACWLDRMIMFCKPLYFPSYDSCMTHHTHAMCRYGGNLRKYNAEWKRLSKPHNTFFAWLDKDREATTTQCTRLELENDTVEYLSTDEQRRRFMVTLCDNHVYSTDSKEPITTGKNGWIFVVSRGYPCIAHKVSVLFLIHLP